jgi:hypothetical protein
LENIPIPFASDVVKRSPLEEKSSNAMVARSIHGQIANWRVFMQEFYRLR